MTVEPGLFSFLVPLQHRSFARRVCDELLELYRIESLLRPQAPPRELYRIVVGSHMKVDAVAAEDLLNQAEESFSGWPTPRPVSFSDVAHMVVIAEIQARFGCKPWFEADLGHLVAARIPHDL